MRKISEEELINDIILTCKKYNNYSLQNYKEHGSYCPDLLYHNFGFGWKKTMKMLNLPFEGRAYKITKEDLVNDVLSVFKETNNYTQNNYLNNGSYSRSIIKRIFGSWNNMLKELGYKLNMHKPGQYSKETLKIAYFKLKEKLGHCPTAYEYRTKSGYSQAILHNLFSSYNDFLCYVNDVDAKYDNRGMYSKKDIIDKCKNIYEEYGFISMSLLRENFNITPQAIYYHFNGLDDLYKECDIEYNIKHHKSLLFLACYNIITNILGNNCELEKTFNWLKNHKTGRNLFIDIYYPKLYLAIEIDGEQHYTPSTLFKDFKETQYRDNIKNLLVREHGIKIIRILKPNEKYINELLNECLK